MHRLGLPLAGTLCLVVVGVLPAAAVAQGDDPAAATMASPGEVSVVSNVVYAIRVGSGGPSDLTLDAYVGGEGDAAPLVVWVPGYLEVARGQAHLAQALTQQGATVLVVDGPNLGGDTVLHENAQGYRALTDAVACAVRFARGSEYGSETAPLVLAGGSYGGGVASHVALAGEDVGRLWDEYEASGGGPPAQVECTAAEASTRIDGFVGVAGTYDLFVGYDSSAYSPYGRDFLLEHEPGLLAMLDGTVGLHPDLPMRLLHGDADEDIPFENSAVFETLLAAAGYDVELIEFEGDHDIVPTDLLTEAVLGLLD
jgi:acetyl esterase/lipase